MRTLSGRAFGLALCLAVLIGAMGGFASELQMAPMSVLTKEVRDAPPEVQDAYRFAIANPGLLTKIPCYCSCETWKHLSNYDCYVEKTGPDGVVVLSSHGLG